MIFVTVGMHPQGFERLVRAADGLAALIEEPVVIQRGGTAYEPISARHFDFAGEAQIREQILGARVIVSHAGAGSILSVLAAGKPLVVAPRLQRLGEHYDDHQLELAETLAEQGRAVILVDVSSEMLRHAVVEAARLSGRVHTTMGLQDALQSWLAATESRLASKRSLLHPRWGA
jgi:UDP-N-acetylglucosamine transferase subunit ALG13